MNGIQEDAFDSVFWTELVSMYTCDNDIRTENYYTLFKTQLDTTSGLNNWAIFNIKFCNSYWILRL